MQQSQRNTFFGINPANSFARIGDVLRNNSPYVIAQRVIGGAAFVLVAIGTYLTFSEAFGSKLGIGSVLMDIMVVLLWRRVVELWGQPVRDFGKVLFMALIASAFTGFILMASMNAMSTGFQKEASARAATQGRISEADARVKSLSEHEQTYARFSAVDVEQAQKELSALNSEFWSRRHTNGKMYSEIAEQGTFAPKSAGANGVYKTAAAQVKAEWGVVALQAQQLEDAINGRMAYESSMKARKNAEDEREQLSSGNGAYQTIPMILWVSRTFDIDSVSATHYVTIFMACLLLFISVYGFAPVDSGGNKKNPQADKEDESEEPIQVLRQKTFPVSREQKQPPPQWESGIGNPAMAFGGDNRPMMNKLSGMGSGRQQNQTSHGNSFAPPRQPIPETEAVEVNPKESKQVPPEAPVAVAKKEPVKAEKAKPDTSHIPGLDEDGNKIDPLKSEPYQQFRYLVLQRGMPYAKAFAELGISYGKATQRFTAKIKQEQGLV